MYNVLFMAAFALSPVFLGALIETVVERIKSRRESRRKQIAIIQKMRREAEVTLHNAA